jgi:hypothetical protein
VLELCRELAGRDATAAAAVASWEQLQRELGRGASRRELRFRRRAYERARERALVALLMRAHAASRRTRARSPRRTAMFPTTRLGVLLGHHTRGRR